MESRKISIQGPARTTDASSSTPKSPEVIDVDAPIDLTGDSDDDNSVNEPRSSIHSGLAKRDLRMKRRHTDISTKHFKVPINQKSFIEIDSDSDVEVVSDADVVQRPRKKVKLENEPDVDSDEDYDTLHAGFDFENANHWKPVEINDRRVESEVIDVLNKLSLAKPLPKDRCRNMSTRKTLKMAPSTEHPKFIWDILRVTNSYNVKHQKHPTEIPRKALHRDSLESDLGLNRLELITSFKQAPGSINKIEQKDGYAAIASACIQGLPDDPHDELNEYNRQGSLMIYHQHPHALNGHYRRDENDVIDKYYAVHDVKFDPRSSSFVSSGADGKVCVWSRIETGYAEKCTLVPSNNNSGGGLPRDLAFKPGESVLAIAKRKLHVYRSIQEGSPKVSFSVGEKYARHNVGAIVWGIESTANLLFASSEPERDDEFVGFHKAFDLNLEKMAYRFDASEAGDIIGLAPKGGQLAIVTRGVERTHILRLYDAARQDGQAIQRYDLDPFPAHLEGEISSATFSLDGIYLALARSDNSTHIYDSRMLGRGLLFNFKHTGPCLTPPGDHSFGVVKAEWVETTSRRLGLVTGGDDGCVRLWDPLKASNDPENGTIIAEVSSDIGHFSLGDRTQRENVLIVGDSAGEVSIFDKSGGLFNGM